MRIPSSKQKMNRNGIVKTRCFPFPQQYRNGAVVELMNDNTRKYTGGFLDIFYYNNSKIFSNNLLREAYQSFKVSQWNINSMNLEEFL